MTGKATKELQQYVNEIYGKGFHKVEYEAFVGFSAVSQREDIPPHTQFLGVGENHAHAYLDGMAEMMAAKKADEKAVRKT